MNDTTLKIEITSDFICPWCFIAERRLLKAAKDMGIAVRLNFWPYELNPDMPPEGLARKLYRSTKFQSWEKSNELDQGTITASADDPLEFNYDRIEFTPNTRNAHRLVWHVQNEDCERAMRLVDAIFEGYFSNGRNIGDSQVLAEIAATTGSDVQETLDFLESDAGSHEVILMEQHGVAKGQRGVPYIKVGDHEVYGAQPSKVMGNMLRLALEDQ